MLSWDTINQICAVDKRFSLWAAILKMEALPTDTIWSVIIKHFPHFLSYLISIKWENVRKSYEMTGLCLKKTWIVGHQPQLIIIWAHNVITFSFISSSRWNGKGKITRKLKCKPLKRDLGLRVFYFSFSFPLLKEKKEGWKRSIKNIIAFIITSFFFLLTKEKDPAFKDFFFLLRSPILFFSLMWAIICKRKRNSFAGSLPWRQLQAGHLLMARQGRLLLVSSLITLTIKRPSGL